MRESVKKHFLLLSRKVQSAINNRKIKTKTTYLYVFCVMLPVLVTNTLIIGTTVSAIHEEEVKNINNVADAVAQEISSILESAVYVTVDLYTSSSISNFLDTQYANQQEYFREYRKVFENYMFYSASKHIIGDITLYSDNQSMTNGGRYFRIETVQNEDWYQSFKRADQDLYIYPYFYKGKYDYNRKRMVSVVRKLNFIDMSKKEKLVKLDLNYNEINDCLNDSSFNMNAYVCYYDKIIFTNDTKHRDINRDYIKKTVIPKEEVEIHRTMSAYGIDFDIYLTGYKSNYATLIKDKLWLITVLFFVDALLPLIIIILFSNSITKRILFLAKHLKKVKVEEFDPILENEGKDEVGELIDNYNLMNNRIRDLIKNEYTSKLEQQELYLARQQAELLALYSQINPHFMFNVLESIRMQSLLRGEQITSEMIESLARLMRKSADWGADLIPLEQEIEFTTDYLNLQRYRFGRDFNFKFRISNECNRYMIPSLGLVSFVENSCVHGLNREGHTGTIYVSAYVENSYFYIEVEDTGVGMEQEQVQKLEKLLNEADIDELQKSVSLGMLNACIRLKKYCGNQTKISIESEKQVGTCIIIKIPVENVREG